MSKIFTRVTSVACSLILLGISVVDAQSKLVSFWDFNQTIPASGGGGDSLGTVTSYINGVTATTSTLFANYTTNAPSGNLATSARIVFKGHPTSSNQSIMDNNNGGSFIYDYSSNHTYFGNSGKYYNSSDSSGSGGNIFVRSRNPVQNDTGYIYLPTTGYQNIILSFAMQQSSTSSGPRENIFQYSTNGYAGPWNKLTSAMDTFKLAGVHKADTLYCGYMSTTWYPVRINFSSDPSVNNISGFVIRWEYAGGTITGTSGNDRYDNFALTADSICPTFTAQPVSSAVCGGGASNASFTVGTEGGTSVSYQWYVNTGGGFTILTNSTPYSNVTTSTLNITGATGSMNGYLYECQVTNPGCGTITSNSATLIVDPILVVSVPTFSNVTCTGNGSATASISGGTSPYTYSWSNNQTNSTATNLIAGTYTITVKDKIGCSGTASVTITQNGLAVNITSSTNKECTAFGSATALASNGTSPYTYSWSDGETNATATALGAGTFTITAKDNTGCTGSTSVIILQITPMRDSISGQYKVIHYWDFNNTPPAGGAGGDSLGTSSFPLIAPYSLIPGQSPRIVYSHPVGGGILDNAAPAANQEAWYNDLHLLGNDTGGIAINNLYIRSRNPEINSFMYLYLPTTGYSNVKLDYAISVSSTKGANYNLLSYSTNGISGPWNSLTTAMDTFNRHSNGPDSLYMLTATPGEQAGTAWTPIHVDFSSDPNINNNPNFVVRWTFLAPSNTGTSGNDRYDNISLSGNQLSVTCNGNNNFTATAGVKYGVSPYTYSWTPGGSSTNTSSNLNAGTYTLTINDANGCTITSAVTVSQPALLTAGISSISNITCNGYYTGAATVSASGGTSPYNYSWAPSGGTLNTINGVSSGTYAVTITDAVGCTATTSVTLSQPATLLVSANVTANANCNVPGSASSSASGGTLPYTYSWSNNQSTSNATGLSAGIYVITITDINGCSSTSSATITQPATIGISIASVGNISCFGGTGTITAGTPSGGTLPYTYSWSSGGGSNQSATVMAGTYTVTVFDNNDCSATASATITQPTQVQISIASVTNASCSGNGSATANTASGGISPYTYSWSGGGGTNLTASLGAGTYTITATDNNGCIATASATIAPAVQLRDSINLTGQYEVIHYWDFNNTLPAGGAGGDSLGTSTFPLPAPYSTVSGGNARIVYSHPVGGGILDNGAPAANQEAWNNDLPLLGNDTAGVATNNLYIRSRNPDINSFMYLYLPTKGYTNVKLDYAISVSSTKGANYNLLSYSTNGGTSWNNLTTAMDTFKRHSNGPDSLNMLTSVAEQAGTAWTPIHIDFSSDPTINNNPNFVVRWTFLAPANTGTSGNDRYDNISLSGNLMTETCNGGNQVAATAGVKYGTAPYTYSWVPSGGSSITASNLVAGTYTLTVRDANGCSGSSSVTVSNPPLLTASISTTTGTSCAGGVNGTATASASGGTSPYKYSWATAGGTQATGTGLSAGTFTVTITDAFGCTATVSATITQPLALVASISTFTNATCSSNGSATAGVTNGTSPYTYSWSDVSHQTTVTATNLTAGTYTVSVTDNHGCTGSISVTITQPSGSVSVSITSDTNVECLANGTASVSPSGGTLPYTYSWSNGQTISTATGLTAGSFTVTVHDNSGCNSSASVNIAQIPQIRDSVSSVSGQLEVIHYWDFNNTLPSSGGGGDSLGTSTSPLNAPYSLIPGSNPRIVYTRPYAIQTGSGATRRDSIVDNYSPTSPPTPPFCYINDLHILGNDSGGVATGNLTIRSRNPDVNSYMYLYLPTTGYSNVVLNYAISASSTKGALYNIFSYSTNGGTSWKNLNTAMDTFNIGGVYRPDTLQFINPTTSGSGWYPVQINFSSDPSINNNPNFILRWEFEGGGANGTSGNDRYDNISLSGSLSTETCYGGNQITAHAGVKYGTAPYTYSWAPSGGSSTSASNLTAGIYTVTVTDGAGCSASSTVTVSNPPLLTAAIASSANVTCSGGSNGSSSATVTGGTSPYKYSWLPSGGTLAGASGLSTGTYTLTVSDAFGCTATSSVTITQPLAIIAAISSYTNATCSTAGGATAGVNNGSSPYTYSWSDAAHQTSVTATSLTAGTYTVTITDNHGCSGSANVTITQPPSSVSVSIGSHTNVECTANGTASAVVSGGSSPYTYSWTDGETTATASALSAGTYTITVSDNTGCNSFNTVTILQVSPIRDSLMALGQYKVIHYWDFNNTPPSAGSGGDSLGTSTNPLLAPYTLIPGGNPRITYNRPLAIQSGASVRDSIMDNLSPGAAINDLPLLGDDSSGTASGNLGIRSRNPDVNQYMTLYLPTTGYSNIVLNYAISASSTKGAFYNIFTYSTNGGATWNKLTRAMDTFNTGGIYHPDTLQMINPTTAASAWYPVQINFSSDPSVNNNPNFILRWQFEGSGSTGTSGNDRYDNISVSGYIPTETCYGGSDVTATAGIKYGTAPYTYSWSPNVGSSSIASNLSAGTYSLTISDANGCSASSSVTVSQPVLLSVSLDSIVNISCNQFYIGAATAHASGGTSPYNYSWSPGGGSDNSINGVSAGTYTVTVNDILGCSASAAVTLTQPLPLGANASVLTNVNCTGNSTGSALAVASGDASPYTYQWSDANSQSTATATGLSAGTYTVTVQDSCGAFSATASVIITQPASSVGISIASVSNVSCFGGSGSAIANPATGGTSPYTYSWSDAAGSNLSISVSAGTYTITVTDSNGCTATAAAAITQPASAVTISIASVSNVYCNGGTGNITANNATGGSSPYTYSWSGGAGTNLTTTSITSGTYTITATDNNGCTATASATVTQSASTLNVTILSVANITCSSGNGSITANSATGGSSPYTYSWSSGGGTNLSTVSLPAGTYTLTVNDAHGCSATVSATITQPASSLEIGTIDVINVFCTGRTGTITIDTVMGGTSPYTYSWSGSAGTNSSVFVTAGIYSVTITDNNGCSVTASVTVTQPATIVGISISSVNNVSCYGGTGTITANAASGGTPPYTYTWQPAGGNSLTTTALSAGTYTIVVIDNNGCTATATASVTQAASALGISIASITNVLCNGVNGNVTANAATGGTAPYTYSWSPAGGTSLTASVSAGTYTITVSDKHGCTATASATITQSAYSLGISVSSVSNINCRGQLGSVTAGAATGGTSPYTYSWSGGAGTNLTINVTAGTYTITVKDANGCTASASTTVTQVPFLGISIASVSNIMCYGSTGTLTANAATGGIAPYTYTWNPYGGTGLTTTAISAGTYTVIVVDNNGCSATAVATLTQPATAVGISIASVSNASCSGGNGSASANAATGGVAPYTYSWSGGGGTNLGAVLSAGTYTITATDNNGCRATASAVITQPANTIAISIASVSNASCTSGLGSATANAASGGTAPYTYSWSDGSSQTGLTATGLSAGTYTVTVSDNNGCNTSVSATITQPANAVGITMLSVNNVSCNGGTGSATANTATGGTAPYTYSWSDAGSQATITATGLSAGTYTVTVTDNNGCSAIATATLTQPATAVSISVATVSNVSCNGGTGSASANAAGGGTAPYTYSWSDGGSQATLTATGLSAGTYTITVTDNNGCTATATATVTEPAALGITIASVDNVSVFGGSTGSATANTATGGTPPYTYSWSDGSSQATLTATGLSAGTYTITVTDNNGCSATAAAIITQPSSLAITIASVSNVSCNGGGNGSITANTASGGTEPYTYSWSPAGGTGLTATVSAGTYTITVTDNNGASATASATVTEPATAVSISIASVSNVLCSGGTGSAAANAASGGTAPYTYLWSDAGSQAGLTATGLSAGTYTITVNDGNGCTATAAAVITQPAHALGITMGTINNVLCTGGTGSATANTATGGTVPYTYSWSDGSSQATLSATGLSAGTYTITVSDSNGCSATAAATITQPEHVIGINVSAVTNAVCFGGAGSATANPNNGGTAPYTYSWSPNGGSDTIASGLSAGTYTITMTDNNGCSATASATVTQPSALHVTTAVSGNVTCNGLSNGSGTVSASGGTSPYTYSWSNGITATTNNGLSAGTYTVTVTDNKGCSATRSMTIAQPAALTLTTVIQANVSCNSGSNGIAKVGVSGGSLPYTYSWSSGSTTYLANTLSAGTYTVTVMDRNGCSNSATATITQPLTALGATVSITYPNCVVATGSAGVGVSGGTPPYTYTWSPPVSTTSSGTALAIRTYVVSVKDAHGCTTAVTFAISQPPVIRDSIVRSSVAEVSCGLTNNGSATVGVKYGTQPYTYSWTNGSTTATASGLTVGTYSVTVRDANTCNATATVTITQTPGLTITTVIQNNVSCNGGTNGIAKAGVSGGVPPYTYSWSPGASTTYIANGLSAGTYTVSITDKNGCNNSATAIVTQPAAIRDSLAYINNATCHGGTGSAGVGVAGGTAPYTYIWSPSVSTTANATGLTARTYVVSIKDADGCTAFLTFSITQPLAVHDSIVRAATVNVLCNGSSTGSATVGAKNGTQPYTYSWSNGNTTATAGGLSAGVYSVTLMDGCGNSATAMVSITQPNIIGDSISSSTCTGGLITATVGVRGGVAPYTYSWSPGGGTRATMSGLSAGTYSITVTDRNHCSMPLTAGLSCDTIHASQVRPDVTGNNCCPGVMYNVDLYPNPNTGQFTIAGVEKGMMIEVYDYTGRKVSVISAGDVTVHLDIANEPNGVYLVRILDKDGNLVSEKKVVKVQ